MVLCDSLICNVPGTLTIEVVANEESGEGNSGIGYVDYESITVAWSQKEIDTIVNSAKSAKESIFWGVYMLAVLLQGTAYESYESVMPHWCRIAKAFYGHVTATKNGEECDVATAATEYVSMGDCGYTTNAFVFTFDRIGLRKDDIANAEDWLRALYGEDMAIGEKWQHLSSLLLISGFLNPQETMALIAFD